MEVGVKKVVHVVYSVSKRGFHGRAKVDKDPSFTG